MSTQYSILTIIVVSFSLLNACSDSEVQPWTGKTQNCPNSLQSSENGSRQCVALKFMTWNIGNANVAPPDYPLRLSLNDYEAHIGSKIRELEPDLIFLQEVLNPALCALIGADDQDADRTCYKYASRAPQVQRLLGPSYSVACDANMQADCIAVRHQSIELTLADGTVAAAGSYNAGGAATPAFPSGVELCDYALGNCSELTCDRESSVSAVSLSLYGVPLRAIHAHPNAPGLDADGQIFTGGACRTAQLRTATELLYNPATANILAGDFNLVWPSPPTQAELVFWQSYTGGKPFIEIDSKDQYGGYHTSSRRAVTVDHVWISDMAGSCDLYGDSLPKPGELPPLDADFDWTSVVGGGSYVGRIDHFPQVCQLQLPVPKV